MALGDCLPNTFCKNLETSMLVNIITHTSTKKSIQSLALRQIASAKRFRLSSQKDVPTLPARSHICHNPKTAKLNTKVNTASSKAIMPCKLTYHQQRFEQLYPLVFYLTMANCLNEILENCKHTRHSHQ